MPCSEHNPSCQVAALMDIAAALADCTLSPERCAEIPPILSRALQLDSLTLAVIRQAADDAEPQIIYVNSSGPVATSEAVHVFQEHLIQIFKQTKPLTRQDAPALRQNFHVPSTDSSYSEMDVQQLAIFPRATVFARTIDASHRMLLIVHQRSNEAPLSNVKTNNLLMIAQELAKQLYYLISWQNSPDALGQPFSELTEREWVVLRGLNSDAGEKQLADQLGLSPHTLHSHIKAIYRKIGVQGRLPLLLRFNAAIRSMRTNILNVPAPIEKLPLSEGVVAAG